MIRILRTWDLCVGNVAMLAISNFDYLCFDDLDVFAKVA